MRGDIVVVEKCHSEFFRPQLINKCIELINLVTLIKFAQNGVSCICMQDEVRFYMDKIISYVLKEFFLDIDQQSLLSLLSF